jgi:hypothetical protein
LDVHGGLAERKEVLKDESNFRAVVRKQDDAEGKNYLIAIPS